ncbi:EAL domain-containing protein [Marinomonas sp. 15G1-11]|uniref:EAL domain-containing protein n=1 Tax=Marinomonas phaeophyticola TaxID=3004091 RepID=A0ABT4JSF1_9GAMM|nr:EAL domain-containing protein [Marinomonas sp. 15G1-11]MCZ2721313.1 EAL domain-containing protein [Marinomonas sp. 15G1-11]
MSHSPLFTTSSSLGRFYQTTTSSLFYFFFIIVTCWGMFSLWETHRELEQKTQQAIFTIDRFLSSNKTELHSLVEREAPLCDESQINALRSKTFMSPYAKELSLMQYGEDGRLSVYCTNLGEMTIPVWRTIQKRLEINKDRFTLAYTKAKLTGQKSLFSFYVNERGLGANSVIPADLLIKELQNELNNGIVFRLFIVNRALHRSPSLDSVEENLLENFPGIWDVSRHSFLSNELRLELGITTDYFIDRLWANTILFLIVWIACASVTHLLLLWYRDYLHSFRRYLKAAIEQDDMELHYQPIVDVYHQTTPKVEALLRWSSDRFGSVSPIIIVEKAVEFGLMQRLTQMVFSKVVDFLIRNEKRLPSIMVNINIDRGSFLNSEFIDMVSKVMKANPFLIGRIGFEVTENNNFNNEEMQLALRQFQRLKACGIGLSVDDFGTGYSGLDFLRQFPYETLKIDKIFVKHIGQDRVTNQILDYVIKLAQELDMSLVAEGVETKEQLDTITSMGIHSIQGYYFSRPLSETAIIEWLANQDKIFQPVALS